MKTSGTEKSALAFFKGVATDAAGYARQWKSAHHRQVLGHFCSYTPVEVIAAAGLLPYRIFGDSPNPYRADEHLQAYCCHPVRSMLDDALSGRLDFMDGAVFPHTCDSMQRLSDIWRLNIPSIFHADIVLPVKVGTEGARAYTIELLEDFAASVEKFTGRRISKDDLAAAAQAYNRQRQCIRELYELKSANPAGIKGREVHAVVKSAMLMDAGEWLERIPEVTAGLKEKTSDPPAGIKRVVLTGGICQAPDIYDVIENTGAAVVWDDLCTGARYVEADVRTDSDVMAAIAERYLNRSVCPAKHSVASERADRLLETVRSHRADGVIFFLMKFCDPQAFDFPHLKKRLEAAGIPCLLIEIERPEGYGAQLKTRCEAFVEML